MIVPIASGKGISLKGYIVKGKEMFWSFNVPKWESNLQKSLQNFHPLKAYYHMTKWFWWNEISALCVYVQHKFKSSFHSWQCISLNRPCTPKVHTFSPLGLRCVLKKNQKAGILVLQTGFPVGCPFLWSGWEFTTHLWAHFSQRVADTVVQQQAASTPSPPADARCQGNRSGKTAGKDTTYCTSHLEKFSLQKGRDFFSASNSRWMWHRDIIRER